MALPSSGPISSSMIATEFSASYVTNVSLSALGTKLSTPITAGQPVNLATSFYGQSSGAAVTAWTFPSDGGEPWETTNDACSAEEPANVTLYHDGVGAQPANGDVVYVDDPGTSPAQNGVYAFGEGRGKRTFLIVDQDGLVSQLSPC